MKKRVQTIIDHVTNAHEQDDNILMNYDLGHTWQIQSITENIIGLAISAQRHKNFITKGTGAQ